MTNKPRPTLRSLVVALLLACVASCTFAAPGASEGDGGDEAPDGGEVPDGRRPIIVAITPIGDALTGVTSISATFSEPMDPDTLTADTFTLTSGTGAGTIEVVGVVTYSDVTATLVPAALLANNGAFTATITVEASSAAGFALAVERTWSFTTGTTGIPVDLGTAGNYAVLAKAAITTVPPSLVTGDLGISPAAASSLTGFELTASGSAEYMMSTQVLGSVFAADFAPATPAPATLTAAVTDMQTAFTAASLRTPDVIEPGAIGGRTLAAGVYRWAGALAIPADVTLAGTATDVWIFQVAGAVTMTADMSIVLTGGALAKNVFWQVEGAVTLGERAHLDGIVLTRSYVTLETGASIAGRVLAQTAVTIGKSAIAEPAL